jgi:hypothetical protein
MTTTAQKPFPDMPAPRIGMAFVPVTTYEELPIVTDAARAELLESLKRGEDDKKKGLGKLMSADELKGEMRAGFEKITGYKIS